MRVAALTVATVAVTFGGQQTTPPTFSARTDVVVLDVSVRHDGTSIRDLTASEFRVTDNGVPQTVQFAETQEVPLDVTVLDDSWNQAWLPQGRGARAGLGHPAPSATELEDLAQLLRPGDRLGMMGSTNTPRELLPLTVLPAHLPLLHNVEGLDRLIDALALALLTRGAPGRRHVLLAQIENNDNWSVTDPSRLAQLAQSSDVVVEVGVPVIRLSSFAALQLRPLAQLTGGDLFEASGAPETLRHVVGGLASSYLLTYRPSGVPHSGWHAIAVSVTRPGIFVIGARHGYVGN